MRTLANGVRLRRQVSLIVDQVKFARFSESGAGKSMIGKAVLGVLPPSVHIIEGRIRLEGVDLGGISAKERRRLIGAKSALIPQDPLTALNPSRRVGPQMTDRLTKILGWDSARAKMPIPSCLMRCRSAILSASSALIRTSFRAACASAS